MLIKKYHLGLYAVLTAIFGAGVGILGKNLINHTDWISAITMRLFFTFILGIGLTYSAFSFKLLIDFRFWVLGVLGIPNIILFMYAIQYTSASLGQLIYMSVPLFSLLFAQIILHTKLTFNQIIGTVVGIFGILVLLLQNINTSGSTLYGNILVVCAACMHSLYVIYSKKYQPIFDAKQRILSFMIVGLIVSLLIMAIFPMKIMEVSNTSIYAAILLAISSVGLHYMTQYTNQLYGVIVSSSVLYLQPFLGVLFARGLLGESISFLSVIGGLIAISGVYIISKQ